jgi:leucyl aminopeptidase
MEINTGTHAQAEVMIELVFSDGEYAPSLPLSAKMKERGGQTWFYGRHAGEQDILVIGLGARERFSMEILREAAGNAGRAMQDIGRTTAELNPDGFMDLFGSEAWPTEAITAWTEGWQLGTYTFNKYKGSAKPKPIQRVRISPESRPEDGPAAELGRMRAESTALARDLCNEAASDLNPSAFVARIRQVFAGRNVKLTVYQGEELKQRQMNGLLAVGAGSKHPPAMVEISYEGDPHAEHLALVGKGITFDMGGMNIKSGRDLSDARFDMGGACAVLGAMDMISRSGIQANVTALIATADNMPDARAFVPSTVITYPNGITVQVGNTDAEGRLVLADALLHADRLGAREIVDIATLTGNVGQALGLKMAGAWGDRPFIETLAAIGEKNGDRIWPMPLIDEYEEQLHSDYADMNNISHSPYGGAIVAALFLRRFVDKASRWVHIDMANTVQVASANGYYTAGATGYGARLLADFVASRVEAARQPKA